MKKIVETNEVFNSLLGKYLNKSYLNNASRLIRDYSAFIRGGRLYYIEKDNYLFFLEDCKGFYNLYYFILETNLLVDADDLKSDVPVVADDVYSGDKRSPAVSSLLEAGFEKYLTRVYETLKINEEYVNNRKDIKFDDVRFAHTDDADFILQLQNEYIDKYTGNALSEEDMLASIKNDLVLGAYEGDNLTGYLRLGLNKKTSTMEGLVVDGGFRGKGYSKQLINYLIDYCYKRDYNKIDLWVRDDNVSALKLYDFFGFEHTKYKCDNYIKY